LSIKEKIRQWTIPFATGALLSGGGFQVATFDDEKGYGIVDTVTVVDTLTTRDTIWFKDSVKLEEFARFGVAKFK